MKKLLLLFLLFPALAWGQSEFDTLYPDGNGTDLNADDNNTAGCGTTASNYLRVNAAVLTDTVSFDAIVGVCNTGDGRECYTLTNFTRAHDNIIGVKIRAQLQGTVALDSARLYFRYGTDTSFSPRFAVTTSNAEYEFTSTTPPDGSDRWDNAYANGLEIGYDTKLGVTGRIWLNYIRAVVESESFGGSSPSAGGEVIFYFPSTGLPPDTIPFGHGLTTKWSDTVSAGAWWGGSQKRRHKLVIHTASNTAMETWLDSAHTAVAVSTVCYGQWVSDLMSKQTFLGTITGFVKASESSTSMNASLAVAIYVIDKDGTSLGQVLPIAAADATTTPPEFGTTYSTRNFLNSAEVTPVPMTAAITANVESVRVVVELGIRENSTTASHQGRLRIGCPTDSSDFTVNNSTANGRPWIRFKEGPALWQADLEQDTLHPDGSGSYTVWVNGNTCGTPAFDQIDEGEANDGDATYVMTDNLAGGACLVGPGKASYAMQNLSGVGPEDSVIKVEFVTYPRSNVGNALEAADSFRVFGRTTTDKFNEALDGNLLGTSYVKRNVIFTNRPNGGFWDDAAVDSSELGIESFLLGTAGEEQRMTLGYMVVYWKDMPAAESSPAPRRRQIIEKRNRMGENNETDSTFQNVFSGFLLTKLRTDEP